MSPAPTSRGRARERTRRRCEWKSLSWTMEVSAEEEEESDWMNFAWPFLIIPSRYLANISAGLFRRVLKPEEKPSARASEKSGDFLNADSSISSARGLNLRRAGTMDSSGEDWTTEETEF